MTRDREDIVLTVGFAAAAAGVLAQSVSLSPVARRAPLVVAIPTLALLLLDLGSQLEGSLERWMCARGIGSRVAAPKAGRREPAPDASTERRRELAFLGWVSSALALSYGAGMSAGLALFVLLYLRRQSGQSWRAAVAAAFCAWVVLQGVLASLLRVRLFEGLWARWVTWPW